MATIELTPREILVIKRGLILLRDRHYKNYFNAKSRDSETAIAQRDQAEALDQLRFRIERETN